MRVSKTMWKGGEKERVKNHVQKWKQEMEQHFGTPKMKYEDYKIRQREYTLIFMFTNLELWLLI